MRTPLEQLFLQYGLAVGTVPTQLNGNMDATSLITTFVLSVPASAANNVFLGDGAVTIDTGAKPGIEIIAGGGPTSFSLNQIRQLYEVQYPIMRAAEMLECAEEQPFDNPIFVWNPSNIYLIAVAATTIGVMLFKEPFV